MTLSSKPLQHRSIWIYLTAGLGVGLVLWLILFLVTNFYMFSDNPGFVLRYLIETIVERPHVPMRFGLVGLTIGAVAWAIRRILFKGSTLQKER